MDPIRIANAAVDAVSNLSGPAAYATIVGVLFICGLGIPIPEDITLLAAGFLAGMERISLTGALIAGFTGVMLGDALMFFLGRRYGKRIFSLPGLRKFITPERILAAEDKIRRNGPFICFVARFLPGLRSPVFAMSGALGVKPSTFFMLDGFAALISVPVWVGLGYFFGHNMDEARARAQEIQGYVLTGVILLVLSYVVYRLLKRRSVAPAVAETENRERVHDRNP
jgi:membrane protein DedA with SNARE-associated domain